MILVTTTPSVDGYTITNYQGIVFGEVVSGVEHVQGSWRGPAQHVRRPQPGL